MPLLRMASRGTPPGAFPRERSMVKGIHLEEVAQTESEAPANAIEAKDRRLKAVLTSVGAMMRKERKESLV